MSANVHAAANSTTVSTWIHERLWPGNTATSTTNSTANSTTDIQVNKKGILKLSSVAAYRLDDYHLALHHQLDRKVSCSTLNSIVLYAIFLNSLFHCLRQIMIIIIRANLNRSSLNDHQTQQEEANDLVVEKGNK